MVGWASAPRRWPLICEEIADIIPNIAKLSEPQRLRSGRINGAGADGFLSRLGDLSAT